MPKGIKNYYDPKVVDWIIQNHKGITKPEMIERIYKEFGIVETKERIKIIMAKYNLRCGVNTKYRKGNVPFNKGKKPKEYMKTESLENMAQTQYKKGNQPNNTRPIGSKYIDSAGIIYIKVHNKQYSRRYDKWKSLHSVLWRIYNNQKEIPKGHVVIFADGNNRNFAKENLVLVTHRELLYINRYHLVYNDIDMTKAGILIAKIDIKSRDLKRGDR